VEHDRKKKDEERKEGGEKDADLERESHIKADEAFVGEEEYRKRGDEEPTGRDGGAPRVEREKSVEEPAERELRDHGKKRYRRKDPRVAQTARFDEREHENAARGDAEVYEKNKIRRPEVNAAQKYIVVDEKARDERDGRDVVHVPPRKFLDISGEFDESGSCHINLRDNAV